MGRNAAGLLIALALGFLVLPVQWIFAAILAALWHEACHYFAIRLCGGQAVSFRAGLTGAVMRVQLSGPGQELLCALAGPAGSLFLLLFVRLLPRTAICAGFQGFYNLLPIYPLDGGRGIRCLAELIFPPRWSKRICRWLEKMCLVGLIVLSIYGCFGLRLGAAPLIVGMLMICRIKIPCKQRRNSVQWGQYIL